MHKEAIECLAERVGLLRRQAKELTHAGGSTDFERADNARRAALCLDKAEKLTLAMGVLREAKGGE